MLFGLAKENKGYCRAKCRSQMCGIYENALQAVQVFENEQYTLLIRNCDDLLLQPILPFKQPPYFVRPADSEKETQVRKSRFALFFLQTDSSFFGLSQLYIYSIFHWRFTATTKGKVFANHQFYHPLKNWLPRPRLTERRLIWD